MIDLHTHSTASDGTLRPAELVKQAAVAGISTLALTDHDCVAGIEEATQSAELCGIQLIPGVELSVTWSKQTLHLLGLNIDVRNSALNDALDQALNFRRMRAREIAIGLERHGVNNALQGALRIAQTDLISRSHFAHYLVEQGHAKDMRQVFKRFMVRGKPGFVNSQWMSLEQGIALVHQAGGVAVLAHPARYKLSRTRLRGLLEEFKALGANGIEVVSGSHSLNENHSMAQHALDLSLPASQGSDYHGPEKPWVKLGKLPPLHYRCTPIWKAGLDLAGYSPS